jgi:hypothetical protein
MTKEEVMTLIKKAAEELGHVPSLQEVVDKTEITRHAIRSNFVSYREALAACGLERRSTFRLPLEPLFLDWASVVRKLGKIPTVSEYNLHAKYTFRPLIRIFRGWRYVAPGLFAYAKEQGLEGAWSDVLDVVARNAEALNPQPGSTGITASRPNWRKPKEGRKVYGTPMARTPLVFEPTNEAGVAVLFGAVAHDLGFSILHVQQGFPDCEVMREIEPGRCQREIGEFEFESRNFLAHGHSVEHCDLIICWIHNWPECPLEVIELRSALKRIG